jgi:hypothetical protein
MFFLNFIRIMNEPMPVEVLLLQKFQDGTEHAAESEISPML